MSYRLGLIGYPLGHSLSPWIHENYLKRANLNGSYEKIEIKPDEQFDKAIKQLKASDVDGFNITVPYKERIIPYLDELTKEAKAMGAVNTVLKRNGRWIGYNTDGIGYVRSLYLSQPKVEKMKTDRVLILGAGGAARGIYHALIDEGFTQIDIANRTISTAKKIIKERKPKIRAEAIGLESLKDITDYDLIIQTTSVGMHPNVNQTVISLNGDLTGKVVSDIVYQPLETLFLREAKKLGASICYGHTMLLYQALHAFEIWTGKTIDDTNMADELSKQLEGE